jgi:hypothetical protein
MDEVIRLKRDLETARQEKNALKSTIASLRSELADVKFQQQHEPFKSLPESETVNWDTSENWQHLIPNDFSFFQSNRQHLA